MKFVTGSIEYSEEEGWFHKACEGCTALSELVAHRSGSTPDGPAFHISCEQRWTKIALLLSQRTRFPKRTCSTDGGVGVAWPCGIDGGARCKQVHGGCPKVAEGADGARGGDGADRDDVVKVVTGRVGRCDIRVALIAACSCHKEDAIISVRPDGIEQDAVVGTTTPAALNRGRHQT